MTDNPEKLKPEIEKLKQQINQLQRDNFNRIFESKGGCKGTSPVSFERRSDIFLRFIGEEDVSKKTPAEMEFLVDIYKESFPDFFEQEKQEKGEPNQRPSADEWVKQVLARR